jgi:cyclohexanone monooxygenase
MTCEPTQLPDRSDVDISALRQKYREERSRRLRLDGQKQYTPAAEAIKAIDYSDPHMPRLPRQAITDEIDVAILGGGWAGILTGHHMRKLGIDNFRIIEQAGDFGGVWYWNRYPGLSCDNDSYCYLPLLEEMEFFPSKKFADGLEIREYSQRVALCGNIFRWHRERRTHLSAEITDEMTSSISQASLKSVVVQAEMPIEAAIADRPTSQSRRDSHPRP